MENNQSGGIGFCGLLAIVFIVLKLTATITWSWWWVLSPLWLPLTVILSLLIIIPVTLVIISVGAALLCQAYEKIFGKKTK